MATKVDREAKHRHLQARIKELQEQLAQMEQEESRFGDDSQYAIGTVLRWQTRYSQQIVQRAAIKYGEDKWVTTASSSYSSRSWQALVRKDLMSAFDDRVEVATDWEQK